MNFRAAAAGLAFAAAAACTGCASLPPPAPHEGDAYANFLVARLANLSGDYQAASSRYQQALALAPRDGELLSGALIAALATGDGARALELARVEPAEGEASAYARIVRAADAIAGGRYQSAREQLEHIEGAPAEELTGSLLMNWARTGESRVAATSAELDRLAAVRPYGALFAYQQGMALDYAGDTEAALAAYQSAAGGALWIAPAVERHADLLARTDAQDAAAALLSGFQSRPDSEALARALARLQCGEAVAEAPLNPARGAAIGLFGLGAIFVQENDNTRGLVTLTLALMLDSRLDAARLSFARAQSELHHASEARAALQQVPANSPYYETAQIMIAWVLKDEGRTDEALAQARQMAMAGGVRGRRALADMYRGLEHYAEAEPIYTELIAAGSDEWRLYLARAAVLDGLGRWPDAEADLQRALELSPDQPDVLNFLGYMWVDRGERLQDGLAMIQRAVALRPTSAAIIDSLGWAYFQLGDFDKAQEHLERAVELEPASATLNDHLGDLYWRLDRFTEARFQWRRALALEPDNAAALEAKIERGLPAVRSATR